MRSRLVGIVLCVLAISLAIAIFYREGMVGFPDGGITDYDRALHFPRIALGCISAVLGVLLGAMAIKGSGGRFQLAGTIVLAVVAVLHDVTYEHWLQEWSGLNYGQGG